MKNMFRCAFGFLVIFLWSSLYAINGVWIGGSGSWNNPRNWFNGAVPTFYSDTATFGNEIKESIIHRVEETISLARLTMSSAYSVTLFGSSPSLVMYGPIYFGGGRHTVDVSVVLETIIDIFTLSATDKATISGVISGTRALKFFGNGTLELSGVNTYVADTYVFGAL